MTAKMTDDELRLDGFLRAKAIYLPQIQQLQGEIEKLRYGFDELWKSWAKDKDSITDLTDRHDKLVNDVRDIYNVGGHYLEMRERLWKLLTESEDKG